MAPRAINTSKWPVEAQQYLGKIPNRSLNLEMILRQAVSESDVFRGLKSETFRAQAAEMGTLSAEDLKLKASYNYFDLKTDPINPAFQTIRTSGWETRLGVEQYFATGTNVTIDGVHGPQTLDYRTNPTIDIKTTSLTFGLSQSLWADAFGSAYRHMRRSSESLRKSIEDSMMSQIELSALDVINLYYQTWLKQKVSQNLEEGTQRRSRLIKILRSQEKRGVLESTDLLQVESLNLSIEAEYLNTQRDLQTVWEQLVFQLKLPRSFLQINAYDIPMQLDEPEAPAVQLCQRLTFQDLQNNSYALKQLDNSLAAASEQLKAMESKMGPDLSLKTTYAANGVDPSGKTTVNNVRDRDFPAYTAGVYLTMPLQNRAAKAQYYTAKAAYEQVAAQQSLLSSQMEASWRSLCLQLDQKRVSRDKFGQINDKNKKRVALENRRFHMGRIRALEWTQAEEDEANFYLKYQQSEIEVRMVSWEIQKQAGKLSDFIRPMMSGT